MAERGVATNKIFVAKALAMETGSGFDRPLYLALDGADMSGLTAASNALAAESAESGLARASSTLSLVTTTVTDDTCRVYKEFTAAAADVIYGAGVFNAASTGNMMAFHEWPDSVSIQIDDVVKQTVDLQDKIGAT